VFELLTQQFELAQIQEAKDIPVLSVIDAPGIPEKRSFPPRTLMILILTVVESLAIAAFIIMRFHWQAVDSNDPRRIFAGETSEVLRSSMRKISAFVRRQA
jgi:hypothetical protein